MKHLEVAVAIIHQAGWVLICQRRKDASFANLWEFPGGKLEPGETAEQCVAREVTEELGFLVKPTAPFPTTEYRYPDFSVCIHPFLCTPVEGHPRPLACQRMKWVQADQLANHQFPGGNADLVRQVIARLSSSHIPELCESAVY